MTLVELLDAAYTSEYIELHDCDNIKAFAKAWKDFLAVDIEDIQLIKISPQYGVNPLTGKPIRKYNTTYKDLLKSEYKYLLQ